MASGSDWTLGLFEAFDVERTQERLVRLASDLALKSGRNGVTSSDLRIMATAKGILTGGESESQMNQLRIAVVMRRAGLVASGEYRRSSVPQAKRSPNVVYTLPEFSTREGVA